MTSLQPSPQPSPGSRAPARAGRASLVLSALAAVLAGFGLGTLALSLTRPVPEIALLPPVALSAPIEAEAEAEPAAGPDRPWPHAFGTPVVAAPDEPEPEPAAAPPPPEAPPPPPAPAYTLRGTITDGAGGWVLADGPDGIELVRLGRRLSGGELVIDISAEGVVLERDGRLYDIDFEPETLEGPERPAPESGPRGPGTTAAPHAPPWAVSPLGNNTPHMLGLSDPAEWPDDFDPDDDEFDDEEFESWMDVMDALEDRLDEDLMDEF